VLVQRVLQLEKPQALTLDVNGDGPVDRFPAQLQAFELEEGAA